MYLIAVAYLEWIRWVATGWLRCADRVVWLDGFEDQQGMDALMDRTPDLQVSDDQGYVIAQLKSDALISDRHNAGGRAVGHLWLDIAAVSSFHPLSARGARLLEADAERAAVRLGEPIFEKMWSDWRDRRLEEEAHWRGRSLCAAFGLQAPDTSKISSRLRLILSGIEQAPNAAKLRENSSEGTRAFGWAAALSVAIIEPQARSALEKSKQHEEVISALKSLKTDFDIRRPLLDDDRMMNLASELDKIFLDVVNDALPLFVMSTVLHYIALASAGREVSLAALVADLADIALEGPDRASISAYFIGRSMENIAVTTLLYQSNPAGFSALTPTDRRPGLDVMALAAARFEAKQPTDQREPATPGTAEADSNNENPAVSDSTAQGNNDESPIEGQILDQRDPMAGNDGAADDVNSALSTNGGSRVETPIVETVGVTDVTHAENTPEPSELRDEVFAPLDNSSAINEISMSQQTMDGPDPTTTAAKTRKNRKKSDKTF